jgi:hypothetical protein
MTDKSPGLPEGAGSEKEQAGPYRYGEMCGAIQQIVGPGVDTTEPKPEDFNMAYAAGLEAGRTSNPAGIDRATIDRLQSYIRVLRHIIHNDLPEGPKLMALKELSDKASKTVDEVEAAGRFDAALPAEGSPDQVDEPKHKPSCPVHFGGGCETTKECAAFARADQERERK